MISFCKPVKILSLPVLLLAFTQCSDNPEHTFCITEFGAESGGDILNTNAINKAIGVCHQNGGGTVLVPPGEYLTGTIQLLSNVELKLSQGARLKGSPDTPDYTRGGRKHGLIYAEKARNISITGPGTIDGNGTSFFYKDKYHDAGGWSPDRVRQGEDYLSGKYGRGDGPVTYDARPGMMIVMLQCENIRITDITLTDSPSWTVRAGDCDNAVFHGVTILNNLLVPNSDGIHCTTSRNITISDCDIRAGDDAIIVTGFGTDVGVHGDVITRPDYTKRKIGNKTGYSENVTVSNCLLQSRSSGIRVGYGKNPIRNCLFQNLVIYGSNRGLGVFSRDRGTIENIHFSNIIIQTRLHTGWWGNGEPVHVSAVPRTEGIDPGVIRNIRFHNITAWGESGMLVYGSPESVIRDISFENIDIHLKNSKLNEGFGGNFDLRPTTGPENGIFKHDIPGLYVKHTENMTIRNFSLEWDRGMPDFYTNGLRAEFFKSLLIDNFSGLPAHPGSGVPVIHAYRGRNLILRNCVPVKGTPPFLKTSDVKNIKNQNP